MDTKIKALYICIKKQLENESHPIRKINRKFAELFCQCYKRFVDRNNSTSVKLKTRLDKINTKMLLLSQNQEMEISRPGLDHSEGRVSPAFQERPNYLLTQQIVGDIKIFIKVILTTTCQFYMPVIKDDEIDTIKEDLVE